MIGRKSLKVSGAVKVGKNLHELGIILAEVEGRRMSLLHSYASTENGEVVFGEDGSAVFPDAESEALFASDFDEVLAEEVDFEPLVLSVADMGKISIEPQVLLLPIEMGVIA